MALILSKALEDGETGEYWNVSSIDVYDGGAKATVSLWKNATLFSTPGAARVGVKIVPLSASFFSSMAPDGNTYSDIVSQMKKAVETHLKTLAYWTGAVDA